MKKKREYLIVIRDDEFIEPQDIPLAVEVGVLQGDTVYSDLRDLNNRLRSVLDSYRPQWLQPFAQAMGKAAADISDRMRTMGADVEYVRISVGSDELVHRLVPADEEGGPSEHEEPTPQSRPGT